MPSRMARLSIQIHPHPALRRWAEIFRPSGTALLVIRRLIASMQISPSFFPALNAFLNGSSAVLIGSGYYLIKNGRREAHKRMMIAAFVTSTLFLISYLYYHVVLRAGVTHFQGRRRVAAGVLLHPDFAHLPGSGGGAVHSGDVVPGAQGQFRRHKAIARYTFPIWMYVSVTGVVIFVMLYKIFVR